MTRPYVDYRPSKEECAVCHERWWPYEFPWIGDTAERSSICKACAGHIALAPEWVREAIAKRGVR